jgi:hypothetical protein
MIADLFRRTTGNVYPQFLYRLTLDMFAVVQYWEPFPVSGPQRGRLFEALFYRYCRQRGLALTEKAGSHTLRRQYSASGFRHESDAVIVKPELTVHLELKYLSQELTKNDLMVFNQKGLDFLASTSASLRRLPLYRILLSGSLLTPQARRFALQWGILVIEPERMPLLLLHWLAGQTVPGFSRLGCDRADKIWAQIPNFVVPLQQRVKRLVKVLDDREEVVSSLRIDRMTRVLQRSCGGDYWSALDAFSPRWLEDVYQDLALDTFRSLEQIVKERHEPSTQKGAA